MLGGAAAEPRILTKRATETPLKTRHPCPGFSVCLDVASKPNRWLAQTPSCTYNVHMNQLRFEWDTRKASTNLKKHGISFEEAKSAFYDEHAKLIDDPDHSVDEERFILLGLSFSLRLVVVCHCYRFDGGVIRIISARKATAHETKHYKKR